ncbi:MAG: hypothetical protein SFU98_05775 [Leptospiraceae bacterium]|nr:hypothetical protein [Leptospiraceae bacterium]
MIGARACALHGYIRATEDIDILLQKDRMNLENAMKDVCVFEMNDTKIPYLGIDSLIKSKGTNREQDIWDVKILTEIKKKKI